MKRLLFAISLLPCLFSCIDYGPGDEEEFSLGNVSPGDGVFITCEGNFMYGNGSLSYYTPSTGTIRNSVFARANALALGDVPQSMAIHGHKGYVVVNNSGAVFVIDINTLRVLGQISPLTSPRHVHFVNDTKGYITDLYQSRITVFNPDTYEITGHIDTGGHSSTEQMVQYGKYVFTNCWSRDNTILVIDTDTDTVADAIEVAAQPRFLVLDKNGKIWTVTDGRYGAGGNEIPALFRIDAATRQIERRFELDPGEWPAALCLNGEGDTLYFINKSVWRMDVTADRLPDEPFIGHRETIYYSLGINPVSSDIYVADAIDYSQAGVVYRYTAGGELSDTFKVGITPGSFCFR